MPAYLQLIVLLALSQGALSQTLVVQNPTRCSTISQNSLGGNGCLASSVLNQYVKGVICSEAGGLVFNTFSDSSCTTQLSQYTLPFPFADSFAMLVAAYPSRQLFFVIASRPHCP